MLPETKYTMAGDISIAYQTFGEGPIDLVLVQGYATHLDLDWEIPIWVEFAEGLASFARVIHFDKRGTGLSDRSPGIPTLEERMEDVRAVMDAAGSQQAVLFGVSEGAPMSLLFAATYPERTKALVLYGGMARSTWAPDYPWASRPKDLMQAAQEFIAPYTYTGDDAEYWMPSFAGDAETKASVARYRRSAVSPSGLMTFFQMFMGIDVRHVLPTIHVPTLVMHRYGDRIVNRRASEWMASQIPGAKYLSFPGRDHFPWAGDSDAIVAATREFLTGERGPAPEPDRVLATIMFTDIVGSTERASAMGDAAWRQLLEKHHRTVTAEIDRFHGRAVKTMGDGVLATFDGPGRAVRCARAIVDAVARDGVEVRVGLHCGEVEVMGTDVGGIAVHIAARIGALASAGEVLVSSTIPGLVAGSGLRFSDRGEHELKGIPDRWRLSAVDA
jgi:class 3 adenylate cyclase/alpha-beta hydrolase superfamily lysophospholipase